MKMMWGTQINFFPEDFKNLYSKISRNGLKFIEIRSPTERGETISEKDFMSSTEKIEKIVMFCKKFNLDTTYHAPQGEQWNFGKLPFRISYKRLCECINRASSLYAEYLTIHLGIDRQISRMESIRNGGRVLQAAAPFAKKKHVVICVENVLRNHSSIATPAEYVQLFKTVSSSQIQFTLDTGHAHIYSCLFEFLSVAKERLAYIHIHDNNGKKDQHLSPGHGTIDWRRFMKELKKMHYTGYMNFEIQEKCVFRNMIRYLERK